MQYFTRFTLLVLLAITIFTIPAEAQKKQKDARAQAAFDAGEFYAAIDLLFKREPG